jgi:hypothetical protein
MELRKMALAVASRNDLASFVVALKSDLEAHQDKWENPTLDRFLDAMESWIESMDGYYRNRGQEIPQEPTWRTFAEILCASRIYE